MIVEEWNPHKNEIERFFMQDPPNINKDCEGYKAFVKCCAETARNDIKPAKSIEFNKTTPVIENNTIN